MNGKNLLVDTNILIYLLDGDETVENWLDQKNIFISSITQVELFSYQNISRTEEKIIRELLQHTITLHTSDSIIDSAIHFRKVYSLKVPDSIIAGTANTFNYPFLTADSDFKKVDELNLYLYEY